MRARWMWNIRQLLLSVWFEGVALPPSLSHITTESQWRSLKWFTEFGHLNRGDMLTSEQHRCHNEKEISAQSLNANPLNWSLTRTTPWQMQPALWMSAFPQ
jgi:hypothetical protein